VAANLKRREAVGGRKAENGKMKAEIEEQAKARGIKG